MRISFLSAFYPYRGGIAQSAASVYRAAEAVHEVQAYTFTRQYPDLLFPGTTQYVQASDKADPIPARRILDSVGPGSWWQTAKAIGAPDLVVMRYWMPFFAPALGTVARLLPSRTTVVSLIDNLLPHERRLGDQWLTRYFLGGQQGFVVMSRQVERDLLDLRPDAKVRFHPHPPYRHFGQMADRLLARHRLGISPDRKVLLCFGLIRAYKGLEIALQAFGRLDDSYTLIIAGEAYEDYQKYKSLIAVLPNGHQVIEHIRYIPDEEVRDYFGAADALLAPYHSATQSGILAIAHHFGLPVIVTDVGGLREDVELYGSGIVVSRPDPMLVAEAIPALFAQRDTFVRNIRRFQDRYTWESLVDTLTGFVTHP